MSALSAASPDTLPKGARLLRALGPPRSRAPACLACGPSGAEATYCLSRLPCSAEEVPGGPPRRYEETVGSARRFFCIHCPCGVAFRLFFRFHLFVLYLYVLGAAARRGPGPISAASRRRLAALSRARLPRSGCRPAKAARPRLVTLGPSLSLDRANITCVPFFIVNSCSLSCIFTYRALPPLRGSRPDVGSTPTESRAPIPRTALSGLTAGLRQRGLVEAFYPLVGCYYIHDMQRSPSAL